MQIIFNLLKKRTASTLLLLFVGFGLNATAAQHTISMTSDWEFSPSYLEIEVGDIVAFINQDYTYNYHDSYCQDSWYTGLLDVDESVSYQFFGTGTYNYRDTTFGAYGMTGTIVVKAAAPPQPATLLNSSWSAIGGFQCTVSNLVVGKTYYIEASTNLVNWTSIATNVASAPVEDYIDAEATALKSRFYRSVHLP